MNLHVGDGMILSSTSHLHIVGLLNLKCWLKICLKYHFSGPTETKIFLLMLLNIVNYFFFFLGLSVHTIHLNFIHNFELQVVDWVSGFT